MRLSLDALRNTLASVVEIDVDPGICYYMIGMFNKTNITAWIMRANLRTRSLQVDPDRLVREAWALVDSETGDGVSVTSIKVIKPNTSSHDSRVIHKVTTANVEFLSLSITRFLEMWGKCLQARADDTMNCSKVNSLMKIVSLTLYDVGCWTRTRFWPSFRTGSCELRVFA